MAVLVHKTAMVNFPMATTLQIFTTKLQRKCCSLDFTTTDCSILQIIVLLKGNLLQFKVPASSSSMFEGVLVSNPCLFYDKS